MPPTETVSSSRSPRLLIRSCWIVLTVIALFRVALDIQFVRPVAWDEAEFGRATGWIASGQLPYRDFWEHHTPLQWFLFAPLRVLINGATGATPFLALRWMQLPLWFAAFALMTFVARRMGVTGWKRWTPLLLLMLSPAFEWSAIEYRVDTPGIVLLMAAMAMALTGRLARTRWTAIGVLLSLAVLANMRLAPLAIFVGLSMLFIDVGAQRWFLRVERLWLAAGLFIVLASTAAYVTLTGSRAAVIDCLVRYNLQANAAAAQSDGGSFWRMAFQPIVGGDAGALLLLVGAIAGAVLAVRNSKRPGVAYFIALVSCWTAVSVYVTSLHYEYHFELIYIMAALLCAYGLQAASSTGALRFLHREWVAIAIVAVVALLRFLPVRSEMQRQDIPRLDALLRTVDRITTRDEPVWDACGYVYSRRSPYRYWFLPAGIRTLALQGQIAPYDVREMANDPPAAIWYSSRTFYWLSGTPQLARFVSHEYMPLHEELWIPAMSAALPQHGRAVWMVPRTGRYRLYASSRLLAHPWFHAPLQCGLAERALFAELHLDLHSLASSMEIHQLRASVAGKSPAAAATGDTLTLERGSMLQVESSSSTPLAVMVVPADVHELFAPVTLPS